MLASKDKNLYEASDTIFRLSADAQIRKQCRDREEYYQDLRNYERVIAEKDASIAEKGTSIVKKDELLRETLAEAERLRALLKEHGIVDKG